MIEILKFEETLPRTDVLTHQCSGPQHFRWGSFKIIYVLNSFSSMADENIIYDSSYPL